jgi:hypothetical protein
MQQITCGGRRYNLVSKPMFIIMVVMCFVLIAELEIAT